MKIIPVIDYKEGNVVHAKLGKRDNYKPVSSSLCGSSNIYDVINAILTLVNFKTIYIADLDCIEKQQLNSDLWIALSKYYQNINFWVDFGSMHEKWHSLAGNTPNIRPILGSESFKSCSELNTAIKQLSPALPLISIDIKGSNVLGPEDLLYSFQSWSNDAIILSIDHVGSHRGPNIAAISQILSYAKDSKIYYGGGIRDKNDINELKNLNIDGALVASALHNGKLTKQDILELIS